MSHAIFYAGPFEANFKDQAPGTSGYRKRDGTQVPEFLIPSGSTGLRFAQMVRKGNVPMITRVMGPTADICLTKPILGQPSGPPGSRLTDAGARAFLVAAIKANPKLSAALQKLLPFLSA